MNDTEWLAERRNIVGGSDAAGVCNRDPHKTSLGIYLNKTGQAPEIEATAAMRRGLIYEEAIGRNFSEETGIAIERPPSRIVRHPDISFLGCSPDFLTCDGTAVVQCKFAGFAHRDEWGESGTDQVPEHYLLQVAHELAATCRQVAYIPVLFSVQDFRVFKVERDEKLIESLLTIEAAFWQCVLLRTPPEPDFTHADTPKLLAAMYGVDGSEVTLGDDDLEQVTLYEDYAELIRAHTKRKDEAKAHLLNAMGAASVAYLPDGRALTRKEVTVKAHPVDEFTRIDFRIKKGKVRA